MSSLRNWVPFLVYGGLVLAVAVVVGIILTGLVLAFGGAIMNGSAGIIEIIFVVVLCVALLVILSVLIGPMIFASQYAGYKDTLATPQPPAIPAFR